MDGMILVSIVHGHNLNSLWAGSDQDLKNLLWLPTKSWLYTFMKHLL